jgi:copper chaperone NosL
MISSSRVSMLVAGSSLLLIFLFPIWKITLVVPQYPQGIKMFIWVDKIAGDNPATLQNINILNHYIGMKPIEPDSIPELRYIKYILLGISALAFLMVLFNKWQLNLAWIIIFAAALILAFYDFYLWEYDYGHNLNPSAAIRIEGMAFQPPLIGKKQILNFTAISSPHVSSIFICISMLSGTAAVYLGIKNTHK